MTQEVKAKKRPEAQEKRKPCNRTQRLGEAQELRRVRRGGRGAPQLVHETSQWVIFACSIRDCLDPHIGSRQGTAIPDRIGRQEGGVNAECPQDLHRGVSAGAQKEKIAETSLP